MSWPKKPSVMAAVGAALKLPRVVKELVDDCTGLVFSLQTFLQAVTTLVDEAIEKVDQLKHTEIENEAKAKFEEALPDICRHAMMCISSTSMFLSYGQDTALRENMKDGLELDDLQPLKEFLGLLKRSMNHAKQDSAEFKKVCNEANKSFRTTAKDCRHNSRRARSKKIATRAIGGTTAATALTVGAGTAVALTGGALSIAAGFFTFGVGTVVGLGITAAASAAAGTVVGAGAAVTTHVIASDFKATEKRLSELAATFESLWQAGFKVLMQISAVEAKLKSVIEMIHNINYSVKNNHSKQSIYCSLELLFTKFNESSDMFTSCKEQISSVLKARGYSEYI